MLRRALKLSKSNNLDQNAMLHLNFNLSIREFTMLKRGSEVTNRAKRVRLFVLQAWESVSFTRNLTLMLSLKS